MTTTKTATKGKASETTELEAKLAKLASIPVRDQQIIGWFASPIPDAEQAMLIKRVRDAGAGLATMIRSSSPNCGDQVAALRKVREAVDATEHAIMCRGR